MNRSPRFGWPTRIALASLASVAVVVTFLEFRDARNRWMAANDDLRECRRLARQIESLQAVPTFAAIQVESPSDLADHIDWAVKTSSLTPSAVVRVQPQPSVRLGNSAYRIFPTRLELKQVTLAQTVQFAELLNVTDQGLTVRDLRIWDNSREASNRDELWWAEITLTQVSFSPKTR